MSEVIAEVNDFPGLLAALRQRVASLRTTYAALDAISGMADGYCEKVLRNKPEKRLGITALGPLLGTLGLKLVVVVDDEQWAKVVKRMTRTKWVENRGQRTNGQRTNGEAIKPALSRVELARKAGKISAAARVGNSEWGLQTRLRALVLLTPKFRQRAARKAGRMSAKARRKVRDRLVQAPQAPAQASRQSQG